MKTSQNKQHNMHPICLSATELGDVCRSLSDASNKLLQTGGKLLDQGRDEEAMEHWRESRRLHKLHKGLFVLLHPHMQDSLTFI